MITCKTYYLGGIEQEGVTCLVIEFEKKIVLFNYGRGSVPNDIFGTSRQIPNSTHLLELIKNGFEILGLFVNSFASKYIGGIPNLLDEIPNIPIYCSSITARILERYIKQKSVRNITPIFKIMHTGKALFLDSENDRSQKIRIRPFNTLSKMMGSFGYYLEVNDQAFCIAGEFIFGPKHSENSFNDITTITKAANDHPTLLLTCDGKNSGNYGYTYPKNSIVNELWLQTENTTGTIVVVVDIEEANMFIEVLKFAEAMGKNVILMGETLNYHYNTYKESGDISDLKIKVQNSKNTKADFYLGSIIIYSDSFDRLIEAVYESIINNTRKTWQETIDVVLVAIQYLPLREIQLQKIISELAKIVNKAVLITKNGFLSANASFLDIAMLQDILRFQGGYFIMENVEESVLAKVENKFKSSSLTSPLIIKNFEVLEFRRNRLAHEHGRIPGLRSQTFTSVENHKITSKTLSQRKALSSGGIVMISIYKNNKPSKNDFIISIKTRGIFATKAMGGKIKVAMKKGVSDVLIAGINLSREILIDSIRSKIKSIIKKETKKQPIIDIYFCE